MIETVNLTKVYGELTVLDKISEHIYEGEKVAIIGPSGSGKSTFLRCLNCMEDPTSGSIFFDGSDLADMKVDINIARQKIGMVFQQFNLFNNKNVLENITLAPIHVGVSMLNAAKRKNFRTKIANLFRSADKKKALIPITTDKKAIIAEADEKAMSLLARMIPDLFAFGTLSAPALVLCRWMATVVVSFLAVYLLSKIPIVKQTVKS